MPNILVVEDDPLVSKTLVSHLKKKGFEVRLAETGEEALAMFREFQPELMLLDVKLPDMNGLDLLKQIKSENKKVSVIVMTAFDDMKTTVDAIKSGAFEYLVKPLDYLELDLTIEKALQMNCLLYTS